jgi:hypothetical protein
MATGGHFRNLAVAFTAQSDLAGNRRHYSLPVYLINCHAVIQGGKDHQGRSKSWPLNLSSSINLTCFAIGGLRGRFIFSRSL